MRFSLQVEPQLLDGPRSRNIVVVAPHPDDEIIGPGGTLLRMARTGRNVTVLFVTSGKPMNGPCARRKRGRAARCAASSRGLPARLQGRSSRKMRERPSRRWLRKKRPARSSCRFSSTTTTTTARVNEALLHGLAAADQSGGPEIWAYQVYTPLPGNVVVDITDLVESKAKAIRCYASQMQRRDWAHYALGLNAFNCRLLPGQPRCPLRRKLLRRSALRIPRFVPPVFRLRIRVLRSRLCRPPMTLSCAVPRMPTPRGGIAFSTRCRNCRRLRATNGAMCSKVPIGFRRTFLWRKERAPLSAWSVPMKPPACLASEIFIRCAAGRLPPTRRLRRPFFGILKIAQARSCGTTSS